MLIKKNKIIIVSKHNNIIKKQFIGTMKLTDRHRKGPRNCVCTKPIDILYKNEVNILKKLEKYNHFPKLISKDDKNKIIYISYCGKDIDSEIKKKNKLKKTKDWKKQINDINNALIKENIYNNDICKGNICINNNIIYLIDFGCVQPLDLKLKENYDGRDNIIDLINLFTSL